MARREIVILEDDLDGGKADETVRFALDGVQYEIDLSEKNASKLRKALVEFTGAARKAPRGGSLKGSYQATRKTDRERNKAIRAWAKNNGIVINDRGRVAVDVMEAYEAQDPTLASGYQKPTPAPSPAVKAITLGMTQGGTRVKKTAGKVVPPVPPASFSGSVDSGEARKVVPIKKAAGGRAPRAASTKVGAGG